MGISRAVGRWAGLKLARRLARSVPVIGTLAALALAGREVQRKGLVAGALSVGLDALPVVGALKNGVELFTGDLFPDRTRFGRGSAPSLDEAARGVRRRPWTPASQRPPGRGPRLVTRPGAAGRW